MLGSLVLFIACLCTGLGLSAAWTTTYHFTPKVFHEYPGNIVVTKNTHRRFAQLLVSWNADLPEQGFFRFYVEVFDEQHKQWSLYKMYEWGADVSRSFFEKGPYGARYVHVRFEGSPACVYKKFKIRVDAVDGAKLTALRHIAVCASTLSLFRPERTSILKMSHFKNCHVHLSDVPCISQHDEAYPESTGWCSPTSLAQVIEYYTHEPVDVPAFARAVYDEGLAAYGSWSYNTAAAAVYLKDYICYVTRLNSIKDLVVLLLHGHPVVLSIWCARPLPGAPKAYDKGHLITVVGIDVKNNTIICHDTAEKDPADMVKHYPLEPFMRAWERRYRLAYIIMPGLE